MPDINNEASAFWNAIKPIIDSEIDSKTRGMVQRRKMTVTTAPSLLTNTIGVSEPFGTEIFIPFTTSLISAQVGDVVWVEFVYGMTNAYASMFASADDKDMTVAGDLTVLGNTTVQNETVGGYLDIINRHCKGTPSSAGWYRILTYAAPSAQIAQGRYAMFIDLTVGDLISDAHKITIAFSNYNISFLDETGTVTGTSFIDQVRYTYNGATAYVDVHYTGTSARTVWAYFQPFLVPEYESRVTSQDFVAVAASPSGETVVGTYTFVGNTDPIDISSEFTFNSTDITIASSYVVAWYEPKTGRVSIDYSLRASAIFGTSTAFLTCNNASYCIATQTDFPAMIYNNNTSAWDAYYVRAATNGQFTQKLTINATKTFGHVEYYV